MSYIPTIGLEIHAELKTKTKMFCDSLNDPREHHPNVNICPVCTGHPGTLPTINKEAIRLVLFLGLALNGKVAEVTKFDRKNYFYPDLPKGYQISQYDEPLVSGAALNGIRIKRVHLEEDAGSLLHKTPSSILPLAKGEEKGGGSPYSLVDYNRASRPLMELVTEPDLKSGVEAKSFGIELQRILRYLGASDADMEHGQMRVEANISVRKNESDPLGTKVEVKNINSFKAVEAAINYELSRQEELLEKGERVIQETRGWDDIKQKTVSQRSKEEAHDYRYFPEPDLPPLVISKSGINLEELKDAIPELPSPKRERFMKEYALSFEQADILVASRAAAEYFEEAVSELKTESVPDMDKAVKLLYNYYVTDFWGILKEFELDIIDLKDEKVTPENFSDLIVLIAKDIVTSRNAKDILRHMVEEGGDPREILQREGLEQITDTSELEAVVKKVIEENLKAVEDYKKGKSASLQFLVGKSMAILKGKGNPGMLQEIIKKLLV